jgi:hypothetical protein
MCNVCILPSICLASTLLCEFILQCAYFSFKFDSKHALLK